MGVYRKGKHWYIDYYFNGRRKREKIGPNRRLAQRVLEKRKVEIAENRYLDKRKESRILFRDFAELFLKTYSAAKKSYERDLRAIRTFVELWGNKLLSEITPLMIEQYRTLRKEKVKPGTINREVCPLKTMFKKAVEWGKLNDNPAKNIKPFKLNNQRKRYISQKEFESLYNECSPAIKPVVLVARHTGLRRGEILNLKWEDIDFKNRLIYVVESKNNERREVPMNQTVFKTLKSLPIGIFSENRVFRIKHVAKSFERAKKRAGIVNFTFHDLRHTFASHLVMAGIDLNTVRELLGHKDIKMTLRYSHLSPSHKRNAIEVLDSYSDIDIDTNTDTKLIKSKMEFS